MTDDQIVDGLRPRGFEIGDAAIRTDGIMLWRVNDIFMFRQDALDLASGGATIRKVLTRNEGKVFPDAPTRDREILERVDYVAREVIVGGGTEIHVAFPYELSERESRLVQDRIAEWLKGRVTAVES